MRLVVDWNAVHVNDEERGQLSLHQSVFHGEHACRNVRDVGHERIISAVAIKDGISLGALDALAMLQPYVCTYRVRDFLS